MQHFLLSLCLAATIGAVEARMPSDTGDSNPIIISPKEQDSSIGNRSPEVIPISGYVDDTLGAVVLNFSYPCGMVYIAFSNLSDGSFYDTSVNGSSVVVIPLSLSSGTWEVTFDLASGVQYLGTFTI